MVFESFDGFFTILNAGLDGLQFSTITFSVDFLLFTVGSIFFSGSSDEVFSWIGSDTVPSNTDMLP